MADFLKDTVTYNDKTIEIIKVIFALAFNLNLSALNNSKIELDKKTVLSDISFYRMTLGYKKYFLYIDDEMNIAGSDTNDIEKTTPYSGDIRPVSNQIKIAYFLTHNNLIPDIVKENMEVI